MEDRKFKCPKCGGARWSALLKFIPDDAFPPLKTMAEVQAAHDADRGVIWGGTIIPLVFPIDSWWFSAASLEALEVPPRVLLRIDNDRIACECGWKAPWSDDGAWWTGGA